jgi:ABC-type dipeptide/oligopeptide/nickel transport system ATPase component
MTRFAGGPNVPPILEIKNLRVSFLGVEAVRGVSLTVKKGSFTSLVGESGSGKTTTALSVCRLLETKDILGEILYFKEADEVLDLTKIPNPKMQKIRGREIAYIFQDPSSSLNPLMRVGKQIEEGLLGNAKVMDLLYSLKIKEPERVYLSFPHELSGGMKQRAMIAMALINDPKLLIADEPTASLDPETQAEIMVLLKEFQKSRGLSILFVTHNLSLALDTSSVIHVMEKGRIVESLKKEENFSAHEPYAKKLFAAQVRNWKPKTIIPIPC